MGGGDVQLSSQQEMIIYVNNRRKTRHHLRQNKGGEGHRVHLRARRQGRREPGKAGYEGRRKSKENEQKIQAF